MQFSNDPNVEIARMFTDPDLKLPDPRRPLLYLLRRDLQNQYGKESEPPGKIRSPLLTGLGIMVGFEVLTKLWSGKHNARTTDIEKFLQKICRLPEKQAIALAQFRHALAHGYSLQTVRNRAKQRYSFTLRDDPVAAECITETDQLTFLINIWRLKDLFISGIREYHCSLQVSSNLRGKFITAHANIGEIEIKN